MERTDGDTQSRTIETALGPATLRWHYYATDKRYRDIPTPLRVMSLEFESLTVNRKDYGRVKCYREQSMCAVWNDDGTRAPDAPHWGSWHFYQERGAFTDKASRAVWDVLEAICKPNPPDRGGPSQDDSAVSPEEWRAALASYWQSEVDSKREKIAEEERLLGLLIAEMDGI